MRKALALLFFSVAASLASLVGCSSSTDPAPDAGALEAAAPEATASEAVPTCKDGLSGERTDGVVCGTETCSIGEACCLDQPNRCGTSCPNLLLDWPCDRSAHCGDGKTCCFDAPLLDLEECPGSSVATAPVCQPSGSRCTSVACQIDADCEGEGKTCYAVSIRTGPDAATRTIGVCR
jgi:hypothetical protein